MADRYNNINNTSPYVSALKNEKNTIPTSNFDYSRAHHGNMNIGTLEILDCFPTLPKGQYTLSMDLLLKVRTAMKKRIMTGQRVYVHAWYMSYNDLWEGAQNHIDHGRSGLLDINKPKTNGLVYGESSSDSLDFFTPNSVFNQIGIPARSHKTYNSSGSNVQTHPINAYMPYSYDHAIQNFNIDCNALPAVMYQRLYLDKYAPKNLLQNNKNAYPDNAEKIRLAYNTEYVDALTKDGGIAFKKSTSDTEHDPLNFQFFIQLDQSGFINTTIFNPNNPPYTLENYFTPDDQGNPVETDMPVFIGLKRCRQKKGDYFVTSSPFADLLRGEAPTIDLAGFSANVDFSEVIGNSGIDDEVIAMNAHSSLGVGNNLLINTTHTTDTQTEFRNRIITELNKAKVSGNVQTKATANMLRTLIAWTLIKERNALTNGDYNEMVKAQFGYSPNVDDYSAKYIGGFYQDLVFSDVTQTSITQSSSPLGNQAGQAMSANSGFIGKFTAPDYGYIMIIASIVPDEIYNQGIPRFLGELSSDEEYTSPIQNNLPPQAIKYKEIYVSADQTKNEDVFSYTQRNEHLRHRENYASGFVGLGYSVAPEDSSYVQHKILTSTPEFNAKFVSLIPQNVDMSPYAVQNESPYIFTAISNVDKIEPLPYDSIPSDFGFKYA